MSDSQEKVQKNLEQIKNVFSRYKVTHPVWGSPISVSEEMQYNLEHDTLNTLPLYLFKAMTTWGTEEDFKSFLPMILELYTSEQNNSLSWDSFGLFQKLRYAKFEQWEQDEIDAITNLFQELWQMLLDHYSYNRGSIVFDFVHNVFAPQYYLDMWESRLDELPVLQHLAHTILFKYAGVPLRRIPISDIYGKWFIMEAIRQRLETAYFQYIDEPFSKEFSQAEEHLKWFLWYNEPTKE